MCGILAHLIGCVGVCVCVCVHVCVCVYSAVFATSLAKMVQVAVADNCEGTFSSFDHI